MIVFASDNGVAWGEHHLTAARKLVPYEESIRVPLVIRYDPLTHARSRGDGRLALNIDLAPTFAAAAGGDDAGCRGVEVWSRCWPVGSQPGGATSSSSTSSARRSPMCRATAPFAARRYKYVLYRTREEELYDLRLDPTSSRTRPRTRHLPH